MTGADEQAIRDRAMLLPAPLLAALIAVALPLLEGKEPREYMEMTGLYLPPARVRFVLMLADTRHP